MPFFQIVYYLIFGHDIWFLMTLEQRKCGSEEIMNLSQVPVKLEVSVLEVYIKCTLCLTLKNNIFVFFLLR